MRAFVRESALLLPLLLSLAGNGAAQDQRYPAAAIPPGLAGEADAVLREKELRFEVSDAARATERGRKAVTILNNDGRTEGEIYLWYDKFRRISSLEGALLDADGREIRTLGENDLGDYSVSSEYSLYEDSRVKVAELYHDRYPYTVVFTYEIEYDGYLSWPTWYAQESRVPVERNTFEVVTPAGTGLRFHVENDSVKPSFRSLEGKDKYTWVARNLPGVPEEELSEEIRDRTMTVRIAPAQFTLEGYEGDLVSWDKFGDWFRTLGEGRDVLPASAVAEVRRTVTSGDSNPEKIAKLYRYMQDRTRYVSIQLGIGGWQPFDAGFVHERGYGDCKALSNYMIALLKEAGVKAYPALIRNGSSRNPVIREFPANQFNHVIVCVPAAGDTTWLECTSQTMPVGHVGSSNEDRDVLVVTPSGGVLARVPATSARDNFQRRRAEVSLSPDGTAGISVTTTVGGNQQDYVRGGLSAVSPLERDRWLRDEVEIKNAKILESSVAGLEAREPRIELSMKIAAGKFASLTGERLFFQPNLMEKRTSVPRDVAVRHSPVRFAYPYYDTDSIYYSLPERFGAESLPPPVSLQPSFGSFQLAVTAVNDSTLLFTRTLEIRESSVPAKNYAEYRNFFSSVVKADKAQVVLVRREVSSNGVMIADHSKIFPPVNFAWRTTAGRRSSAV